MAKQIYLSKFLSEVEEYEKVHALWCAKLVANGRQTIQSVCNIIDDEHLTNLMDSFMRFISLLALCNPNVLADKKTSFKPLNELSSKQQNESLDLVPKNDIIKMVNNDLQCPICNEWLVKATSANCNHTFCEKCIQKWLKVNKTCPVCRSSIQFTSTSLAIDNFITNLCELIGGIIKERRDSVKNTQDQCLTQTSLNNSVDEVVNDLSTISESIVEDTYYNSLLENTTPMPHPNMVRLIPLQSNVPASRLNSRQVVGSPDNGHPNAVELIPFPRSSAISSHSNQVQLTNTSLVNPQLCFQSTFTSSLNPHTNCLHPKTSTSTSRPPRVNCSQPTSLTPMVNHFDCNLQRWPSSFVCSKYDQVLPNANSNLLIRNNSNNPNLLPQHQKPSSLVTNAKNIPKWPRTKH